MFLDDLALLARGRFQAIVDDARLFGRDWGFRLADVKVPVRWWHGDADPIVPLGAAQTAAAHLSDAELIVRLEESHLGGFAIADEASDMSAPISERSTTGVKAAPTVWC